MVLTNETGNMKVLSTIMIIALTYALVFSISSTLRDIKSSSQGL